MQEAERSELEKLRLAATPGEWKKGCWGGRCNIDHQHSGPPSCRYDPVFEPDSFGVVGGEGFRSSVLSSDYEGAKISDADLTFIVAACNAVPDLLATISRLEADKVKDGERADRWRDACEAKDGQLCELRAEVRRLSSRAKEAS